MACQLCDPQTEASAFTIESYIIPDSAANLCAV